MCWVWAAALRTGECEKYFKPILRAKALTVLTYVRLQVFFSPSSIFFTSCRVTRVASAGCVFPFRSKKIITQPTNFTAQILNSEVCPLLITFQQNDRENRPLALLAFPQAGHPALLPPPFYISCQYLTGLPFLLLKYREWLRIQKSRNSPPLVSPEQNNTLSWGLTLPVLPEAVNTKWLPVLVWPLWNWGGGIDQTLYRILALWEWLHYCR